MMFLTPREAATLLGLSMRTLARYRCNGKGPVFYKLGGRVRYTPDDLGQWAAARPPGRKAVRIEHAFHGESLDAWPGPR